jgi:transcriptional regulator with PAS, ATPase and Fis domain
MIFYNNFKAMKVLFSWVAFNNDFQKENRNLPSDEGPNYLFHKHHWDNNADAYTKHIILYTSKDEETRIDFLLNKIKRDFPKHIVEGRLMPIDDVINVQEINSKIESLLLEYRAASIDIFISPGTPAMQVAWYLCHFSLNLKTKLFQTRSAVKSKSKQSELVPVDLDRSTIPYSITIVEHSLKTKLDKIDPSSPLINDSLLPLYKLASKVAKTQVTVLILGETGTGKEVLAKHIHQASYRSNRPMISINCSAIQGDILESRLFGHKKGSFTGATHDMEGFFKQADSGTIFLDEIGDISLNVQQSLLRVLQNGEIQPIGGKIEKVDVRIIAATNNLLSKCEEGKFRWDLYYRLAIAEFELPTLRERPIDEKEDFLKYFIQKIKHDLGFPNSLQLTTEAKNAILNYSFPGNIRELENLISRLYAYFYDQTIVEFANLPTKLAKYSSNLSPVKRAEREEIIKALKETKGNQKKAREKLGIKHNLTFTKKLSDYKIDPNHYKSN